MCSFAEYGAAAGEYWKDPRVFDAALVAQPARQLDGTDNDHRRRGEPKGLLNNAARADTRYTGSKR
jgi:hypothetical protein